MLTRSNRVLSAEGKARARRAKVRLVMHDPRLWLDGEIVRVVFETLEEMLCALLEEMVVSLAPSDKNCICCSSCALVSSECLSGCVLEELSSLGHALRVWPLVCKRWRADCVLHSEVAQLRHGLLVTYAHFLEGLRRGVPGLLRMPMSPPWRSSLFGFDLIPACLRLSWCPSDSEAEPTHTADCPLVEHRSPIRHAADLRANRYRTVVRPLPKQLMQWAEGRSEARQLRSLASHRPAPPLVAVEWAVKQIAIWQLLVKKRPTSCVRCANGKCSRWFYRWSNTGKLFDISLAFPEDADVPEGRYWSTAASASTGGGDTPRDAEVGVAQTQFCCRSCFDEWTVGMRRVCPLFSRRELDAEQPSSGAEVALRHALRRNSKALLRLQMRGKGCRSLRDASLATEGPAEEKATALKLLRHLTVALNADVMLLAAVVRLLRDRMCTLRGLDAYDGNPGQRNGWRYGGESAGNWAFALHQFSACSLKYVSSSLDADMDRVLITEENSYNHPLYERAKNRPDKLVVLGRRG